MSVSRHRMQHGLTSTCLIILHLSSHNQLRLLLNLLKLDDGPLFQSEPFHFRFQIREEVALDSHQRNEEMSVVIKPSVLSGQGMYLLRVDHYSKL